MGDSGSSKSLPLLKETAPQNIFFLTKKDYNSCIDLLNDGGLPLLLRQNKNIKFLDNSAVILAPETMSP